PGTMMPHRQEESIPSLHPTPRGAGAPRGAFARCARSARVSAEPLDSFGFSVARRVMNIRRVVPDIKSDQIDESRHFYTDLFGFQVAMDMGWIITLVSPSNPTAQLTLFRGDGSVTDQPQMTIEVEDVDHVHSKAVERGLNIVYPLTTELWGVRRFFVVDPNGIILNVMSHVEPSDSMR
ncbi:MAG TPA: VOC family protein, partial [Opitutaceae bacterium]